LRLPFGGKLKKRVALGMAVQLPSRPLLKVRSYDPTQPAWYFHPADADRTIVFFGLGARLGDHWAAGIGVQSLADLVGSGVDAQLDVFSQQVRRREVDSSFSATAVPNAGLSYTPNEKLRFGLAYRGEMKLFFAIPARLEIEGITVMDFVVSGVNHYQPHTITAGVAYQPTEDVTLTFDSSYQLWRRAPSPYVNVDLDLSSDVFGGALDEALDISSPRTPPGFASTLDARLGLEVRDDEGPTVRAGLFYRPTPVPRQDPPETNILDASAIGGAFGLDWAFHDPLELFPAKTHFEVAAQTAYLLPRTADKEQADEVPAYRYQARTLGVSAALRVTFLVRRPWGARFTSAGW
jgi:hypothetical protein